MLLDLSPNLSDDERVETINRLKLYLAAHLFISRSYSIGELARAVNVTKNRLRDLVDSPEWEDALKFWGVREVGLYNRPEETSEATRMSRRVYVSLRETEKIWTEMMRAGGHIDPSRMPALPDRYNQIYEGEKPERVNLVRRVLSRIPSVLRRHLIPLVRKVYRYLRSRCNKPH